MRIIIILLATLAFVFFMASIQVNFGMTEDQVLSGFYLALALCSPLIYWDASKNKIGNIKYGEKTIKIKPVFLAIIVMLWSGTILLYLFLRKKLLNDAKENPLEPTSMPREFAILLLVFLGLLFLGAST